MKPRHLFAFGILTLLILVVLGGCGGLLGTDMPTRIDDFISSLNGDRTQTYLNFLETSGPYAATNGSSAFWDTIWDPTADGTLSYTITSTSYDAAGVYVDITGATSSITKHYMFVFTNVGDVFEDYVLTDIKLDDGSGTYYSIFVA
jgi:hypothetical protein